MERLKVSPAEMFRLLDLPNVDYFNHNRVAIYRVTTDIDETYDWMSRFTVPYPKTLLHPGDKFIFLYKGDEVYMLRAAAFINHLDEWLESLKPEDFDAWEHRVFEAKNNPYQPRAQL